MRGHILSYRPSTHTLIFRNGSHIGELRIPLFQSIHLIFQGPKRCIGYYDGSQWRECPTGSPGPQCRECREKDMKKVFTVRDIRGFEELYEKIKDKTYSIYLALYGEQVKVGVTRADRLEERLREQGAMHYVELYRIRGMDRAYEMERFLQQALGLKGAVRNEAKVRGDDRLEKLREAYDRVVALNVRRPLPFVVRRNAFRTFPTAKRAHGIRGKVISFRGNLVFFRNEEGIFYDIMTAHIGEVMEVKRYG